MQSEGSGGARTEGQRRAGMGWGGDGRTQAKLGEERGSTRGEERGGFKESTYRVEEVEAGVDGGGADSSREFSGLAVGADQSSSRRVRAGATVLAEFITRRSKNNRILARHAIGAESSSSQRIRASNAVDAGSVTRLRCQPRVLARHAVGADRSSSRRVLAGHAVGAGGRPRSWRVCPCEAPTCH